MTGTPIQVDQLLSAGQQRRQTRRRRAICDLVAFGSLMRKTEFGPSPVRCFRRSCLGWFEARRQDVPPRITARCRTCGQTLVLDRWQGSACDLRSLARADRRGRQAIDLDPDQYGLLRDRCRDNRALLALVADCSPQPGGSWIRLHLTEAEQMELSWLVQGDLGRGGAARTVVATLLERLNPPKGFTGRSELAGLAEILPGLLGTQVDPGHDLDSDDTALTFQLRIHLRHVSPRVWRRLVVPARMHLADLHRVLQAALDLDGVGVYSFQVGERVFMAAEDAVVGGVEESVAPLQAVCSKPGDDFTYAPSRHPALEVEVLLEHITRAPCQQVRCIGGQRMPRTGEPGSTGRFDRRRVNAGLKALRLPL